MKCMDGKDRGDIASLIDEGLAEGMRLAAEAHEAIRSRYQDRVAGTLAVALLLWIFLTFVLIFQFTDWGGLMAMMASFIIITAALSPLLYIDHRATHHRLADLNWWISKIRHPSPNGSVFDLLVDVSRQVPVWLMIRSKDQHRRHPFLSTATILTAAFAGSFASTAYMNREEGSLIFAMLIAAALTSLLLFIVSARAIAVADRREREQTLARWNERMVASQQAMEEMLGGL